MNDKYIVEAELKVAPGQTKTITKTFDSVLKASKLYDKIQEINLKRKNKYTIRIKKVYLAEEIVVENKN